MDSEYMASVVHDNNMARSIIGVTPASRPRTFEEVFWKCFGYSTCGLQIETSHPQQAYEEPNQCNNTLCD
jgi:hypothetical protein